MTAFSVFEICAGAGGQALGLECAGFEHAAAVEIEPIACETLLTNRPDWNVINRDVRSVSGAAYKGVDLLAGGVPCPPFSVASRQLGADDDRDLFPAALDLVSEVQPRAVMLENVPGLSSARFDDYRSGVKAKLAKMGYLSFWDTLNASDYGVPQLRPRFILIALKRSLAGEFSWPESRGSAPTVGETLLPLMSERGWTGATQWAEKANRIAPTLVGGSKLHGGPDLGPTRARRQWLDLGVDGRGLADAPPGPAFDVDGLPRLTVPMAALIQGFPATWKFAGRKTAAYRQVGNAFPPPVAEAVGRAILKALRAKVPVTRTA